MIKDKFKCQFCGKEFTKNGLNSHEFWCNPNNLKKEETRKKISESRKGKPLSEKVKNKLIYYLLKKTLKNRI